MKTSILALLVLLLVGCIHLDPLAQSTRLCS